MEWSIVATARYTPVADLAPLVPILREQSEKRRSGDPRYTAYNKVLDRIETINKTEELPLNIDERRQLAKSEKELSELEAELDPDEGAAVARNKGKDSRTDLVLTEALCVLADYVALLQPAARAIPTPEPPPPSRRFTASWIPFVALVVVLAGFLAWHRLSGRHASPR